MIAVLVKCVVGRVYFPDLRSVAPDTCTDRNLIQQVHMHIVLWHLSVSHEQQPDNGQCGLNTGMQYTHGYHMDSANKKGYAQKRVAMVGLWS
jgi:hypothetical protein